MHALWGRAERHTSRAVWVCVWRRKEGMRRGMCVGGRREEVGRLTHTHSHSRRYHVRRRGMRKMAWVHTGRRVHVRMCVGRRVPLWCRIRVSVRVVLEGSFLSLPLRDLGV
jgi:hypothetical protein